MSLSDRECIERCLDGHPEAFGELVQRHQTALLSFLAGRLGSRERAEDAAQETFVRAYLALDRLKKRDSFFPWLFGIASRVAKEGQRAEQRQRDLAQTVAERTSKHDLPDDYPLQQALSRLAEPYREVILLRYYTGLSCAEVAEQLAIPVGTVTKRLSRAYAMLRKSLRQHDRRDDRPR